MNLLQRSLKAVQSQLIQSIQNKGIDLEIKGRWGGNLARKVWGKLTGYSKG